MTDFIDYFIGHTHWLDEELALQIDEFVSSLSRVLSQYEADLADGQPSSDLGIAAAALVEAMVPDAKQALDARFREILYPPPWWTGPLRLLARLQQWDSSKRRD